MNNNNNLLIIILVVIIGILSGVTLLFGIGNAVSVAVGPLTAEVGEIAATQKEIQKKLSVGGGSLGSNESMQLALISQKLVNLENKLGNGGAGQPQPQMPQPPQEDFNKVYDIPVGISPIEGKKDAPVTIVDFSDFQCPFCSRFYPAIKEVLRAYPNQVRVIIKNFPLSFHPNARPAAKLALAANVQGKYYEMADLLFANGGAYTDDKIKEYAKTLGLNYNKLAADFKNRDAEWEKIISDDQNLGAQVDVRGTPTFYINGRKTMARDLAGYKAEIDKILAEKK